MARPPSPYSIPANPPPPHLCPFQAWPVVGHLAGETGLVRLWASCWVSLPPAFLLQAGRKFLECSTEPSCPAQSLSEAPCCPQLQATCLSWTFSPLISPAMPLTIACSHTALRETPHGLQPPLFPAPFPLPAQCRLCLQGASPSFLLANPYYLSGLG